MILNKTISIKLLLLLMVVFLFEVTTVAQNQSVYIGGTVLCESGLPLKDVLVKTEGRTAGVFTDENGKYLLETDNVTKYLEFKLLGYTDQKIAIGVNKQIDVKMVPDAYKLDEVIQLGYTSQLKKEISGSVSTVRGSELEKSPVANFTQTLAGRLSGLTTQETSSELSRTNTNLFVRGISAARTSSPLVIIDGIICAYNSSQTLEYISANEVESVTILKDASTQALYGIQGANGLIVVTTKRGQNKKVEINTRVDQTWQQVTTKPVFYSSAEYTEMRNQAAFNDGKGSNYLFSTQQIDGYKAGQNLDLYPNNNWYDKYFKDFAMMQRVGVNVTGGSDKVQFFSNINMMHQGGQFITDQTKYNPNANNVWMNYRTNVDMSLNRYLKAFIRLSGNIKRERTPGAGGAGNAGVYSSLFQIPPTMYGPLTPDILDSSGKIVTAGGKVITTDRVSAPTYGMLNRTGYYRHTVTNITSQFGFDLDMSFLTKGLTWSGILAYQTNSVGSLATTQDYERFMRTSDLTKLEFAKKGSNNTTPLAYGKSHSFYYHLTYHTAMNYNRSFDKHNVGVMAYMFYQNLTKTDLSSPLCLPYNRVSSGAEANYGYDNRYLIKLDMGYSGSEQYARGSRFIATPAVSAAWIASNENFMKGLSWLDLFKLRASYGKTGNDQSGLSRFSYLDNVTLASGGPIGSLQYMINELQTGNPYIQAEVSTKQNVGLDLGFFNALSLSVDLFKERMENMVISGVSNVPLYQGVPSANYPKTNSGIFENKGYDITVNYVKPINKDLTISAGGMFSYVENTLIKWNEAKKSTDYAYRNWEEGFSYGQQFGYLVDNSNGNGYFNSAAEITSSGLTYGFGTPRVGDLIYKDLNDDKIINEKDKAPIGNGTLPRITYAFNGSIEYKSFDLSFLFQGIGKYSTILNGIGVWETSSDGVFGSLHKNAWTPERFANKQEITYPALSLAKTTNHEMNDFFSYDKSYLRLKNVELSYSLPAKVNKLVTAESARVFISGQNLYTWDKMKSDDFGPEGSYDTFPVYRSFNIGVSVVF